MEESASWNLRGTVDTFWMGNGEDLMASAVGVYTSGLREGLAKDFRASKWFTRGRTLQELLAPRVLRFIDKIIRVYLEARSVLTRSSPR
jgi:hypothetical protein